MTKPKLSLNERLAKYFGDCDMAASPDERYFHVDVNCWFDNPADYENSNLAAFALLEKAKQDGKIKNYNIATVGLYTCSIYSENSESGSYCGVDKQLSKAITQALAQLLTDETPKTCPRCKEQWDEAGGCRDPECPCDKS